MTTRQAEDASRLLGGDYSGYTNNINKNGITHILEEHGPNGTANHSLADLNDAARIGYVLANYDKVEIALYKKAENRIIARNLLIKITAQPLS